LSDPAVDDRPKGKGTVVVEDGGTSQFGFPRVALTFEAAGLVSKAGKSIGITGRLVCDVM
jgi:hypothetical protein